MNKALPVKQVNIGKYVSHFNDKEVNVYKGFVSPPWKNHKETLLFLVIKRKPYQVTFTKVYVLLLSTVLFRLLVVWITEYAA